MKNALSRNQAEQSALNRPKFNAKSTATEAQIERLTSYLRARPHHTHELRKIGISHPAGRIFDLQGRGFRIASSRITTVDGDGFSHVGVSLYELVSEPDGQCSQ